MLCAGRIYQKSYSQLDFGRSPDCRHPDDHEEKECCKGGKKVMNQSLPLGKTLRMARIEL